MLPKTINDKIYNLNTNDETTWNLICRGDVKGVFQLETLGKFWSKQSKPRSIQELSDLISIIRPACLESKTVDANGKTKSITQRYCDRKNGLEEIDYLHPELEPLLKSTYSYLLYQEQSMKLAQILAGFDLTQADLLRKSIGSKDPVIMNSLEKVFVDGCKKVNKVDGETAKVIFENIRKAVRYQFNRSHSVSYAYISYWTAYLKTHYPMEFYVEYLNNAKDKPKPKQEIKELVSDARNHDIQTRMTTLQDLIQDQQTGFYHKDGEILFGVEHVKGIGKAHVKALLKKIHGENTWLEILEANLSKTVITHLISVGFFSNLGLSRKKMLFDYAIYSKLSPGEIKHINKKGNTLREKLLLAYENTNAPRKIIVDGLIKSLDHPPYSLDDDMSWLYEIETELLGISLNLHKTDISNEIADSTCKEINDGNNSNTTLLLEITEPKQYTIKQGKSKGNPMASFSASDSTGEINCLIFSENWIENRHKLYGGAVVLVSGQRSKNGAFVVNKVK